VSPLKFLSVCQKFQIETPVLYVLPDEVGVNALTAGFDQRNVVIIMTWGALQNLDEVELYGLLSHEFNQILSGEAVENTKLKILYSGLITFSQLGSRIANEVLSPIKKINIANLKHFYCSRWDYLAIGKYGSTDYTFDQILNFKWSNFS
jgi:hypothetical protein